MLMLQLMLLFSWESPSSFIKSDMMQLWVWKQPRSYGSGSTTRVIRHQRNRGKNQGDLRHEGPLPCTSWCTLFMHQYSFDCVVRMQLEGLCLSSVTHAKLKMHAQAQACFGLATAGWRAWIISNRTDRTEPVLKSCTLLLGTTCLGELSCSCRDDWWANLRTCAHQAHHLHSWSASAARPSSACRASHARSASWGLG